ncbi:DVU_2496 family lipoprotein [Desulfovibrio sp.]|uniref:DVU_2496 family lipoprotein n=1 Tax=Desulfovibrio sp. TaxID=885 RepID=UPI0023BF9A9A|nr:DVU_2496 family lipoprotein [Desulfovibrio sp.]MDE7241117.1 SON protein [Desulfovibrio sp.]
MARPTPGRAFTAAFALAAALALTACAGPRQPAPVQPPVSPKDCAALYVVAPGNYIVDLAGGSAVLLDPGVREFPLFCAPETAALALAAGLDAGRLPPGDWRVYRVEGGFADLVQEAEPGGPSPYALARKARLADWVDGNEKGEVK